MYIVLNYTKPSWTLEWLLLFNHIKYPGLSMMHMGTLYFRVHKHERSNYQQQSLCTKWSQNTTQAHK